jgi:hypothetical protein
MRVRRYRPAFFTVDDEPGDDTEAETVDELLAIPWIDHWTHIAGFHRLCVDGHHVMAEMDGGRKWWVVAILECDGAAFGLPQWEPVR